MDLKELFRTSHRYSKAFTKMIFLCSMLFKLDSRIYLESLLELSNNTTNMFSMNFVFFTSTFKALILLSLLSLLFSLKSKCLCLIQHYTEETSNYFFSEKLHGSWILRVFCQ